jgi:hypothetical protein
MRRVVYCFKQISGGDTPGPPFCWELCPETIGGGGSLCFMGTPPDFMNTPKGRGTRPQGRKIWEIA